MRRGWLRRAVRCKSEMSVVEVGLPVTERNIAVAVGDSSFKTYVGMVGNLDQCGVVLCTMVVQCRKRDELQRL